MKCNILPTDAEQAKIKEISYLQVQNTKSKIRWWFCMRGTLKAKGDCGFAGVEQARVKGNGLSTGAEC